MLRIDSKLNTVGNIVAVVISFSALLHTIRSDREMREV